MSSVRDLPDEVLHCKDLGHDWDDDINTFGKRRAPWGTRRLSRCVSCVSHRLEIVDANGWIDPTTRSYQHSDIYKEALGVARMDCRAERMRRIHAAVRQG